jgi:SSS family solute:Na+ symporter
MRSQQVEIAVQSSAEPSWGRYWYRAVTSLLMFSILIATTSASSAEPTRLSEEERHALLDRLRVAMHSDQEWIRIHAAEALIWHGEASVVRQVFLPEADSAKPPLRIGVWRVLARSANSPAEHEKYLNKIRNAFHDPAGSDRLHALESLGKLSAPIQREERHLFEQAAASDDASLSAFAWWVLARQGAPRAAERLAELLTHRDPLVRLRSAFALRSLPTLSAQVRQELHIAAEREPDDSVARVYLTSAAFVTAETAARRERFARELHTLLQRGSAAEQREVLVALGEAGTSADAVSIRKWLDHPDLGIRVQAAHALLRIDRRVPHAMAMLDWAVVGGYMLLMLAIGWWYSRRVVTTDDYLLGGRTMRSWTVGLSLFATLLSTITYLSYPGEIIRHGPMLLSSLAALPFAAWIVGRLLIPFIMRLRVTSAYEILEQRLGVSVRILGSLLFLSLRLLWMAVIIHATTGTVLVPLLGIDPAAAPWISAGLAAITIAYTAMGGLRAVVMTDVLQTAILFGGAVLVMLLITWNLGGVCAWWPRGWDPNWQPPVWGYDPTARVSFLGAFIAMLTWHVCTAGSDQMAIQRYLATRDARAARRMYNTSLLTNGIVTGFLALLGLALFGYFRAHPHMLPDGQTTASHADRLFPTYIIFGLPPGITGLVIAGLLAAAMSSLSSGLNSSCSVITVDFLERFRSPPKSGALPSATRRVQQARLISVIVGASVVLLSVGVGVVEGNLLEVAYKVVNLFVAPLFGLFFMAYFVPRATTAGTLIGAAAGTTTAVLINYWTEITGTPGISFLWAMPLSLTIQIVVGTLASLLTPARRSPAP